MHGPQQRRPHPGDPAARHRRDRRHRAEAHRAVRPGGRDLLHLQQDVVPLASLVVDKGGRCASSDRTGRTAAPTRTSSRRRRTRTARSRPRLSAGFAVTDVEDPASAGSEGDFPQACPGGSSTPAGEGTTSTFAEQVSVPSGCTLVSQELTGAPDGVDVPVPLPPGGYDATLAERNAYEVTNTVECLTTLWLHKEVVNGAGTADTWPAPQQWQTRRGRHRRGRDRRARAAAGPGRRQHRGRGHRGRRLCADAGR